MNATAELSELSDTGVAALAREIRLNLLTLPRTHPRRENLKAEWQHVEQISDGLESELYAHQDRLETATVTGWRD
jgi:hypothetical protein